MSYDSLCKLKAALNLGELPDGAHLTVARDIVYLEVGGELLFEGSLEETMLEALQLLGIPAEVFDEE